MPTNCAKFKVANFLTMWSIFSVAASLAAVPLTLALPTNHTNSTTGSYVSSLPIDTQSLFNESMAWMDQFYDSSAGYLYDVSTTAALRHETRSSAWYAVGLLARNEGSDVEEALKIITNIIEAQFKDTPKQWYGDYQQEPEEPEVGSPAYSGPKMLYAIWDPNWRGFVGTTFVVALEEFGHLISAEVTTLIEESLFNNTVGDSYRVGGVDNDNLYPAYSNPSIMRALVSGWTGRRLNDSNMTLAGENYAKEIISLFDRAETLSEFNSGTYTGVSLWALTLWCKYLPKDSVMGEKGPLIVARTWEAVGQLWHPQLKNIAGPWDRSYGFDMNKYLSLMALHFWSLIGKENSSVADKPFIMSHSADFAWGPLIAILAPFHETLIPKSVIPSLKEFSGEHTFKSSTFSPPFDYQPRNITSWLAPNISIGAESFNENVVGGPAQNPKTFNPALVQWNTGREVGFITLYATETAVIAEASPYSLNLTYPLGNSSSIFTLIVSPFTAKRTVGSLSDIQGLTVNVTGNVISNYSIEFAGSYGGSGSPINDFEFWNFTWSVPANLTAPPNLHLQVELW